MADQQMEPVGAPASPPYANGYIVQRDGEVLTLLFMRLPPAYTEALLAEYQSAKTIQAPVVSSVTVTVEGARTFVSLLTKLLADKDAA